MKKIKIRDERGFIFHLVHLHAPRAMNNTEKKEIVETLLLIFSPLWDYMKPQEISRIAGRIIYSEAKARGWRKGRRKENKKKVCWFKEANLKNRT